MKTKRILLIMFGCTLLFLAVSLGIAGAVLSFFFCAVLLSNITLLSLVAILVCFFISLSISRYAFRKIRRTHPTRLALGIGLTTTLGLILISSFTIFKPLVPSSELITPVIPEAIKYWDIKTGSRIAYLRFTPDKKTQDEPVIFLHGGPGGAVLSFNPIVDVISVLSESGFDVYFYDQVGGGLSGRLQNIREYQLSRHVIDLEMIRKKINAEKMILIGESNGGVIAAHYAAEYPENVEKLVLISPGELLPDECEEESLGSIKDRVSAETLIKFESILKTPRMMFTYLLLEINPDAAHNFLRNPEADTVATKLMSLLLGGMACDPEQFPENHNIIVGFWATMIPDELPEPANRAVKDKLTSTNIPTLILRAECDYLKWKVTYEYKTLLKNSILLYLAGAGHMPFLEKPDITLNAIRSYLLDEPLPLPAYTEESLPKK